MIRYDQTGQWPSSRRCGYAFAYINPYGSLNKPFYCVGTTDGNYTTYRFKPAGVSECTRTYDINKGWSAVCDQDHTINSAYQGNNCPKGWGNNIRDYPDADYSVMNAQGYAKTGKIPVYGYVTRYNTKYYNYFAGRVSKA